MAQLDSTGLVYLVTQENLSAGRSTLDIVDAAIDGGVDIIQLREKDRPASERYAMGMAMRERTAAAEVMFIVNDRVDLAKAVNADGVHLGQSDLPIGVARDQLGSTAIIGQSVSTPEEAITAVEDGADYLGVGSIYQTSSKDTEPEKTAIGLDRLSAIRAVVDCPLIGIGGITASNAQAVMDAGATGVAVISEITAANDPVHATKQLSSAVKNGE